MHRKRFVSGLYRTSDFCYIFIATTMVRQHFVVYDAAPTLQLLTLIAEPAWSYTVSQKRDHQTHSGNSVKS